MNPHGPRNTLLLAALGLVAVSAAVLTAASYFGGEKYPHELGARPQPGMRSVPTGTLEELAEFETHLPIVVVEFDGEPGKRDVWDGRKQYAVPIENEEEAYAEGYFRLLHNEGGMNRLADAPVIESRVEARLRGLSSMRFPKKQYMLYMYQEDGSRNEVDVLGMGADWKWVLNISHIDKSLMRNYMVLNISLRIMGYAPESRYCEVFRKWDDRYEYMGVYLLMEPVARGKTRLPLSKYNPRHAQAAYLLRRDRFQPNGIILDTYATINGLSMNYLEVKYPGASKITEKTVAFIDADVSEVERALYSENRTEFLGYRDLLDLDSAIDYFLINEFFANYDSQWNSYYMYKDLNEKLHFGPVWDFDQALGNNAPFELNPQSTAMQNAVWYNRLLLDGKFLYRLIERYRELRRGVLSEQYLYRFMDDVTAYLGDAVARDWNRWRYDDPHALTYAKDDVLHANALVKRANHREEVNAMKKVVHDHGTWMDQNIDSVFGSFVDLDYE